MQVRIFCSMFFSAMALFPPIAHVTAAEERVYLGKAEIERAHRQEHRVEEPVDGHGVALDLSA